VGVTGASVRAAQEPRGVFAKGREDTIGAKKRRSRGQTRLGGGPRPSGTMKRVRPSINQDLKAPALSSCTTAH